VSPTAWTAASEAGAGSTVVAFQCTGRGPFSSTYFYQDPSTASHNYSLLVSRQVGKRTRTTFRLTEHEIVADPFDSTLNQVRVGTVYVVADRSLGGSTNNLVKLQNMLACFILKYADADSRFKAVIDGAT
jgi:hypothetical protein